MPTGTVFQVEFMVGFVAFIVIMLMLDLFVFHRKSEAVSFRDALLWSIFWIALSLVFNVVIWIWFGQKPAMEFLTGYLIEKSLSVDNLFVFLMILTHFKVPTENQHRVLFWGVLGAIVLRGVMIFIGAALVARFHWVLYVFGVFLLYAAAKMAMHRKDAAEESKLDSNPLLKFLGRHMRVTKEYHGGAYFVVLDGLRWATPLVPVIVLIESSDVMFAVDSIPAIFAVTTDPIIVFTSNIFAIFGLRSLYFLLAGVMNRFTYLEKGLAVILAFVGVKILVAGVFPIPTGISLGVVALVMAVSIVASLARGRVSR